MQLQLYGKALVVQEREHSLPNRDGRGLEIHRGSVPVGATVIQLNPSCYSIVADLHKAGLGKNASALTTICFDKDSEASTEQASAWFSMTA